MSADFFSMGGYALYVWGSYAVAAAILVALAALSWHRLRSVEAVLRLIERARPPRARRGAGAAGQARPDEPA